MNGLEGKIIAAVRSEEDNAGRVIGRSLKCLREMAGFTQEQMAKKLSVGQATICKIEQRDDVQVSSLQRYVEALGAKLRIEAAFPIDEGFELMLQDALDGYGSDGGQLILPLFDDEGAGAQRDVVLSIRPQYSEKIMQGKKTVELRRRFPMVSPKGALAYIYSTSPVRALVGSAEIEDVVKLPVEMIWERYSEHAFIDRNDFDNYFSGLTEGYALELSHAKPLPRAINLSELREKLGFEPPQSFFYAKPELKRAVQDEYSKVPH